ncbi:Stc1 domain-containing protein [Aspergillus spectabilis]
MGTSRVSSGGTRSAYAGGYSDSIKRQLEIVRLPDKIRCKTCNKYRLMLSYSNRQLDLVRNAIVVNGPKTLSAGHATCRMCTGGQVTELTCCICGVTKGMSEFAKNQRSLHEQARCLNCVQGHKDAEPIIDENKLPTEGDIASTKGAITASHFGSSLAESTRRLILSDAPGNGTSFAGNTESVPAGGGVWVEPEQHDATSSREGFNISSYNSYSQATQAAKGAKSVDSGWELYGIKSSRVAASVASDVDRKFARIKAYKPEVQATTPSRVLPRVPEAIPESVVQSDEDEDDDDDITGFV